MYVSQMKIEIVLMFKKNVTDSMISCEISWWLLNIKNINDNVNSYGIPHGCWA